MKLAEFYQEEPGGNFTHDGEDYYLNPLFKFTENLPIEEIPVSALSWIIDYDKIEKFDYADTSVPILVTEWHGKLVVIDGYHRLLKAIDTDMDTIPAKVVPRHLLDYFKIDK